MLLQNEVFGDDIRLEGVVLEMIGACRVITSQPAVHGRYASPEEIREFFAARGFIAKKKRGRLLWWRTSDNVVCADTHGGNILVTNYGDLVAIDVPVMRGLASEDADGAR